MDTRVDRSRFKQTLRRAILPPLFFMTALGIVLVSAIANLLQTTGSVAQTDGIIAQASRFQQSVMALELQIAGSALEAPASDPLAESPFAIPDGQIQVLMGLVAQTPDRLRGALDILHQYRRWREVATRLQQSLGATGWGGRDQWRDARTSIYALHMAVERFVRREAELRDQYVQSARRDTVVALILAAGLTLLLGIGIVWSTRRQLLALASSYHEALQLSREQNEAIRVSEARFRNLFDETMVGSAVSDAQGVIYDANDACLKILGYQREDIRQRRVRWNELIAPNQDVTTRKITAEVLANGVLKPSEMELTRCDGTRVPVLCGAKRFDDGTNHGVGFIVDLTETKRAERERLELVNRERHRLAQIRRIATASLAISSDLELDSMLKVITDSAAEIIGAHQAVTTIVQTGNDRSISARYLSLECKHFHQQTLVPSDSPAQLQVCELNEPRRLSEQDLNRDSGWRAVRSADDTASSMRGWLAVPLVARDGRNLGLIQLTDKLQGDFDEEDQAILTQLAQMASVAIENARLYRSLRERESEREQLLDRERRARAEAERASRMKDEFLSNLSHELRTPLNAIVGWSELLSDGKLSADEEVQAVEIIQRNANVQMQLISDLLDMSRIVSGKMQLETQLLDIALLVEQQIESILPSAEQKSIRVEQHLESESALIVGDAARLQQVLWNLLTNAIKFTQPGGTVGVTLRVVDSNVELEVRDTGMGIERAFLPYVFDRFRQADASSRRQFGGLGLGLAIVKQMVELHGGTVTAASAGPGEGATFVVSLPLATDDTMQDLSPTEIDALSSNVILEGVNVLVVDADTDSRRRVALLLAHAGARVIMTETVEGTLDLLASEYPDLLINSLKSRSLIRRVRRDANPHVSRIPAILLADDGARTDGYQLCLRRPVIPWQLISAIVRLVDRPGIETSDSVGGTLTASEFVPDSYSDSSL